MSKTSSNTITHTKKKPYFERKPSKEINYLRDKLNKDREAIIADIQLYEKQIRDLERMSSKPSGLEFYLDRKYILITCILDTYRKLKKTLERIYFCSRFTPVRDRRVAERFKLEETLAEQKKTFGDWIEWRKGYCKAIHKDCESCILCQSHVEEYRSEDRVTAVQFRDRTKRKTEDK